MSNSIIIIGAGMAGLMCARCLINAGFKVLIFDKGRGIGGRIASREIEHGFFNHGASSIPDFQTRLDLPKFTRNFLDQAIKEKILIKTKDGFTSFGSMKNFTKYMAIDIKIQTNKELISLTHNEGNFELFFKDETSNVKHDHILILALPQPQSYTILNYEFPKIAARLKTAKMRPSLTGLYAFKNSLEPKQSIFENDNIFALNENARAGQDLQLDCWTVHSKTVYGKMWCKLSKEEIKSKLLQEFKSLKFNNFTDPIYASGHRWLYGFGEKPLGSNFIYHKNLRIGICGDWCKGNTILDAAISGTTLAEEIIKITESNSGIF